MELLDQLKDRSLVKFLFHLRMISFKTLIPLGSYFLSLTLIFLSGNLLKPIVNSPEFKLGNALFFVASVLVYSILCLRLFPKRIPNNKSLLGFLGVLIPSIFFIFFFFQDVINGRLMLYPLFLSDSFGDNWKLMDYVRFLDHRTFQKVLYDLIQYVFNVSITMDRLILISRFFSLGILLSIYGISLTLTKNFFISFLCVLTFLSSYFSQTLLTSVEYGTPALFFSLISIYYLFNEQFLLSILGLLIATYFRFELAVLAGLPILCLFFIQLKSKSKDMKLFWLLYLFLLFRTIPIASHLVEGKDFYLHGKELSPGLFGFLANIPEVLARNLFFYKDWSLSSGSITIFTYMNVLVFCYFLIKRSNSILDIKYFFISFIGIFYLIGVLLFHIEGLRSGQKYSVNYFVFEILVSYAMILGLLKSRPWIANLTCLSFFVLAYLTSPLMHFKTQAVELIEVQEYKSLKEVSLNDQCYVIKKNNQSPLMTYYFPLKFKNILWEEFEDEGVINGACYYYFDQKYIEDDIGSKVDLILNSCEKKNIFEKSHFGLNQYSC